MEWHHLYYQEVASTLYHKLADSGHGSTTNYSGLNGDQRGDMRDAFKKKLDVGDYDPVDQADTFEKGTSKRMEATGRAADVEVAGAASGSAMSVQHRPAMDIVSAIQETRETVSLGTAKRTNTGTLYNTAVLTPASAISLGSSSMRDNSDLPREGEHKRQCLHVSGDVAASSASIVRSDQPDATNSRMLAACASLFNRNVFGGGTQ